jgi:hypothetical protein
VPPECPQPAAADPDQQAGWIDRQAPDIQQEPDQRQTDETALEPTEYEPLLADEAGRQIAAAARGQLQHGQALRSTRVHVHLYARWALN